MKGRFIPTKGQHKVVWDGQNENGKTVASGMYFSRIEQAGKVITRKMVMLK